MKQLIDDYKRRLDSIETMQKDFKSNGSINDIKKKERLTTKASEYRTFIAELEREDREQEVPVQIPFDAARGLIIKELLKIKKDEQDFKTDYWGMVHFAENKEGAQPIHISNLEFWTLNNKDLVRCYAYILNMRNSISERRVRQYYYGEK